MWVFGKRDDWVELPNLEHPSNSFHPVSPLRRSLAFSLAIFLLMVNLLDAFTPDEARAGRVSPYPHQVT
jgi:hypothetical protein